MAPTQDAPRVPSWHAPCRALVVKLRAVASGGGARARVQHCVQKGPVEMQSCYLEQSCMDSSVPSTELPVDG